MPWAELHDSKRRNDTGDSGNVGPLAPPAAAAISFVLTRSTCNASGILSRPLGAAPSAYPCHIVVTLRHYPKGVDAVTLTANL